MSGGKRFKYTIRLYGWRYTKSKEIQIHKTAQSIDIVLDIAVTHSKGRCMGGNEAINTERSTERRFESGNLIYFNALAKITDNALTYYKKLLMELSNTLEVVQELWKERADAIKQLEQT